MRHSPETLQHGTGATLTLDHTRLLFAFREKHTPEDVERLLERVGLTLEDAGSEQRKKPTPLSPRINHTETRYWARSRRGEIGDEQLGVIEKDLAGDLAWIGPVYRFPNGGGPRDYLCPLPDALVVAPRVPANRGPDSLSDVLGRHGLEEVPEKSRYLGNFRYFRVTEPRKTSAYELRETLLEKERSVVRDARFENMPMVVPVAVVPNDTLFAQQWDMTKIQAPQAWDISAGVGTVVACVLDEGCDLGHPDLVFATPGINLGTMLPDGSPTGPHGTACAGIVAAHFNNTLGIAGVAGQCEIMPLAFSAWTDVEVAAGINYAADNGARVISMSFGWNAWDPTIIDPAIQHAFDTDVTMCVATHNYNGPITYPATNPLVMACGASDQIDNRKSPTSPDGETWWGSDFGPQMSVVAPGVLIPTTDRQGSAGYNMAAGTAGDYVMNFNGTSSATPHVAGLAVLLRSQYPALTNVQVRTIIERTADKVGTVPYVETPGYTNGTWNQEMGYGRINAYRALDCADILIKDWSGDLGAEPSSPPGGDFWDFSDIVVRITDDNVFVPEDPSKSQNVERGQTNYIYIRVTNNGPRDARNVLVTPRITPYVGLQFVYPDDWTLVDPTHVSPTAVTASFATVPTGGSVIAKFTVSATQVEDLWGWISGMSWHPCLLARVQSDNDYGFASADLTGPALSLRRNNLAQRNLSVIDVLAGAAAAFPMVAGHRRNGERLIELVVDRSGLPKHVELLLSLDEDGRAFPQLDFRPGEPAPDEAAREFPTVFLDRCRLDTTLGGCRGILTLEKGSRFDMRPHHHGGVKVEGGEVVLRGDRRFVLLRDPQAKISLEKEPHTLVPLALRAMIPGDARHGDEYTIRVAQQNQRGERVGGATVIWSVIGG